VPEELFLVKPTLTEDGRVGKVMEAQGLVAIRPALHERWTPVGTGAVLKPGDWVRTDLHGPNAARLQLAPRTTLILGPGTLVELTKPDRMRLLQGEVALEVPEGAVELTGPDGKSVSAKGSQLFRADRDALTRLKQEPLWLKGFQGATANESLGSLVAKVDG